MDQKQAKDIFDKYNPADGVVRCPNGRAHVRKLLDVYAKAAVNLYGVISKEELARLFNRQSGQKTSADEIYLLLLPLVLKSKWYGFYKDYIVHYWVLEDFGLADYLLTAQSDKPRYVPEKDEFLKFADEYYENNPQRDSWHKVQDFFDTVWPDNFKRFRCCRELKERFSTSTGIQEIGEILDEHGIVFNNEDEMQEFLHLLFEAKNNTRTWENKGHTPTEMHKLTEKSHSKEDAMEIHVPKKVGLNEPCPCGSGKKYKKCCRLTESTKTAQLSSGDCVLFYETWYGLMGFVNEKQKIISATIKPKYPNAVSDDKIYKVRGALWKNPELIDDYLKFAKLPQEKVELLISWRTHHRRGHFLLMEYLPEYAVVIGSNEEDKDRLYGVKGISQPLAGVMRRQLPIAFETVLLPFKGKIIYDSFTAPMPVGFQEGARKMFRETYNKALEHGIITSLE